MSGRPVRAQQTGTAAPAAVIEVLCVDEAGYRVGLPAWCVESVRDAAEAPPPGAAVPQLALAALLDVAAAERTPPAEARAIRVRTPAGALDLLTGRALALRPVVRAAIVPLPAWLAGAAARAHLAGVAFERDADGERLLMLLDGEGLAARGAADAEGAPRAESHDGAR